mmetsp:Transcript_1392/g.4045  ORF Transcript_1392/g.4045 Transcript_1392/m.4045 type:complete len:147 (+) Transcript_1392:76-516(+)
MSLLPEIWAGFSAWMLVCVVWDAQLAASFATWDKILLDPRLLLQTACALIQTTFASNIGFLKPVTGAIAKSAPFLGSWWIQWVCAFLLVQCCLIRLAEFHSGTRCDQIYQAVLVSYILATSLALLAKLFSCLRGGKGGASPEKKES